MNTKKPTEQCHFGTRLKLKATKYSLSRVHILQTFAKHPKYPTNMFVECLVGINVFPNIFVCQCLKQN